MQKRLSDRVADDILTMIMIEKRFLPGEKLPNETALSAELEVSRTTLREAFCILAANGVVEIRRGLGTFVREDFRINKKGVSSLADIKTDVRDLYEMRLIVEPEAAYYAAMRASDEEIKHILRLGQQIEDEIACGKDRTETERNFHKAIAKATHIEEFRYRFLDGEVVLYDTIHTSFTYLDEETELFKFVSVSMQGDMETYIKEALQKVRNQKEYFVAPPANNEFCFSSLPWISYTHISHTISGGTAKSAPLFDWGKFFERDKRMILPFSVQVHHSFVDGIHVGKLVEKLQDYLDSFIA